MQHSRITPLFLLIALAAPSGTHAQTGGLESALSNLQWRNIGPAIMGGRVSDLAVVESNPAMFYVATATGGVWLTRNNGTTWEPIFDNQETSSIGDVTVAPSNPNVVWVGTGEPQNRQSSPWGNGVYRSLDAGKNWTHLGLSETHHIARIVVHPTDPNTAYVAAVGRLWGPNAERGVFKTTDGGMSWEHILSIDEDTGVIDLIMDPGDPHTLFAAAYQRRRTAFGFNGGGPGSGIYRTYDGGQSWTELTDGLPRGNKGRIGLDMYRGGENLICAVIEADLGNTPPNRRQNGVYCSTDRGDSWEHRSTTNPRPMYYSQIRIDPSDPERMFLGGADLYHSKDGGRTFTDDAGDGVHLDHHALWIDPANSNHLIVAGDGGVSFSWDRAESWRQVRNFVISQFYEIGVDMREPYHVCGGLQDNGSWCAPSATWSNQGIRNRDWYNVGGGDGFFTRFITGSNAMFAESQGGNIARVDLNTMESARIRPVARPGEDDEERSYRFNWDSPILVSEHDPNTVFIGSNHVMKSQDQGWTWEELSPDLTDAVDRSELQIMGMSEDEMLSRHDGTSNYGNITALSESPLDASVLYAGTDDGNLHVTRDGGETWTDVTSRVRGLPENTYVTRVVASRFAEGRVYAAFDGHRNNDFNQYLYVSDDFGQRWRAITNGLPMSSLNAFAEHPRNGNLLFAGNEVGVFVSIDGGASWNRMGGNFPTVPVDDIVIHPRENDLVLGTHGRGIWILDDIGPLEEMSAQVLSSSAHLFNVRTATSYNQYTPQGWTPGVYAAPDAPSGALLHYYIGTSVEDSVTITISDSEGETLRELKGSGEVGMHRLVWDLRLAPPYVPRQQQGGFFGAPRGPRVLPGTYEATLNAGGTTSAAQLSIRLDPRVTITPADLAARQEALMSVYALAKPAYEAQQAVQRLGNILSDVKKLLTDETSEDLRQEIDDLSADVDSLRREIGNASRGSRAAFSIEGSTTRPTADQLWQIDRSWTELPPLIERLNEYITERIPALNERLNEHNIRPDAGQAVSVPRRP